MFREAAVLAVGAGGDVATMTASVTKGRIGRSQIARGAKRKILVGFTFMNAWTAQAFDVTYACVVKGASITKGQKSGDPATKNRACTLSKAAITFAI
jgi:hypothetical protein